MSCFTLLPDDPTKSTKLKAQSTQDQPSLGYASLFNRTLLFGSHATSRAASASNPEVETVLSALGPLKLQVLKPLLQTNRRSPFAKCREVRMCKLL